MRAERLEAVADEYMDNLLTPSFTPEARARLASFLGEAAERVDEEDRGQVTKAEVETRELAERLGKAAGRGAVSIEIVEIEIRGLCPIWPFCQ